MHVATTAPVPVTVLPSAIETLSAAQPFDAVVCALVLCSVADLGDALRQINSVITDGGELRYLEHVASSGWPGRLQRLADATVWPLAVGQLPHSSRHRTCARRGRIHYLHCTPRAGADTDALAGVGARPVVGVRPRPCDQDRAVDHQRSPARSTPARGRRGSRSSAPRPGCRTPLERCCRPRSCRRRPCCLEPVVVHLGRIGHVHP